MPEAQTLHIGFDDTDSPKGMCTTFLAYKIVDYLKKQKAEFLDFPKLIRFNPNIPWKTRGNGAVSLKIKTNNPEKIKEKIKDYVLKYSDVKNGANPGLVFYENSQVPLQLKDFSEKALWRLINRNSAKKFAHKYNLETFHLGNGQGLVGAIGAIGYEFNDYTMEFLSYRKRSMFGKKRKILAHSVKQMQEKTYPHTFNSYDDKKNKVLMAPRGPDPVYFGLRGEDPKTLYDAAQQISYSEKLAGHLIFRSNQGTGDHLKHNIDVDQLKPYTSGLILGTVVKNPTMNRGGHVTFSLICDKNNVHCAVYKPTGLAQTALELIQGDKVLIGGGVRKSTKKYPRIINVELIQIQRLARKTIMENPTCKKCHKKMKSKGKQQGFSCIRCKTKTKTKVKKIIPRLLKQQEYIPVSSAHRHLTRPLQRKGKHNTTIRFDESVPWFSVY